MLSEELPTSPSTTVSLDARIVISLDPGGLCLTVVPTQVGLRSLEKHPDSKRILEAVHSLVRLVNSSKNN